MRVRFVVLRFPNSWCSCHEDHDRTDEDRVDRVL